MVNGVDVNDNLFANPQNLFIEDAIEETQVLTSGISAEYGRFGGGVVNAITKSGGNKFSGSGRVNFLNPKWSTETPFEVRSNVTRPDINQQTLRRHVRRPDSQGPPVVLHGGTLGLGHEPADDSRERRAGAAGRQEQTRRAEADRHLRRQQHHSGRLPEQRARGVEHVRSLQPGCRSEQSDYPQPAELGTTTRTIAASSEAACCSKGSTPSATSSSRAKASMRPPISRNRRSTRPRSECVYNSPYFCACDPEQRNNRQATAALTNFWTAGGTHQTKVGYEFFRSQRTGGNSQSPTNYVFNADYATDAAGKPLLDSSGRFIPVFVPGDSSIDFYPAVIGATLNIDNNSLYVQDHWAINGRWSADLGARYEHVNAISTGDITSVKNNRIVPRLGTAYDIKGNGGHVIHLTYGQYSGRYNEALVGNNSPVGNPADIFSLYQGPSGQGIGFAPGLAVANYPVNPDNASVIVPTANVFTDPSMKSPLVHEFTASYGANLANGKGYAEVAYVFRKTTSIIEDFITRADGTTVVKAFGIDAGEVSNQVYRNTDEAHREYQGMVFQSRYTLTNRWIVNGQYTLQLKNEGNYAGEGTNTPGATSRIGDYPEVYAAEPQRFFPDGRLSSFQRHRMRAWTIYNFGMGRAGDLSVSGLWRVDSGGVYSLSAAGQPLTAIQRTILRNAGYPDAPDASTLYFGARGSEEFPGYGLLDANISYNIPVIGTVRPWVKFDIYNLLNNQKLIEFNTTIRPDPASPLDALGYRTGFLRGAAFGTGTSQDALPGALRWRHRRAHVTRRGGVAVLMLLDASC